MRPLGSPWKPNMEMTVLCATGIMSATHMAILRFSLLCQQMQSPTSKTKCRRIFKKLSSDYFLKRVLGIFLKSSFFEAWGLFEKQFISIISVKNLIFSFHCSYIVSPGIFALSHIELNEFLLFSFIKDQVLQTPEHTRALWEVDISSFVCTLVLVSFLKTYQPVFFSFRREGIKERSCLCG